MEEEFGWDFGVGGNRRVLSESKRAVMKSKSSKGLLDGSSVPQLLQVKMDETGVPLSLDLHAIAPFSFIDYFLYKINDDQSLIGASILQSIQPILSTVRGIDFLEFRPSEIAVAMAISVVREAQTIHTEKAISVLIQLVEGVNMVVVQ
ncbi:Cyclin-D4-1 protein [Spatholobus suberectus]|nr:Cyclin-D4-1 protein [Spatholobus suberectus]